MKHYYLIIALSILFSGTAQSSASSEKAYSIEAHRQPHKLQKITRNIGRMGDSTLVKILCIKKGAIGMPNIAMPSYRGKYINEIGEVCYVYALEPDGQITVNGVAVKVYRVGTEGVLEDGSQVRIVCFPRKSMIKIDVTPQYRGTYYTDTQQCHVYAVEEKPIVATTQGLGGGFR